MTPPVPCEPEAAPIAVNRAILRDLLLIAAAVACLWLIHRLGRIVIVLILAMFLAYVIAPLVALAQRPIHVKGRNRHLPRGAAIALVYLLLAGTGGVGGTLLWPSAARQINNAIASAPVYTESFHAWEGEWGHYYRRLKIPVELRERIDESVLGADDASATYARGSMATVLGVASDVPFLILIPIFAFLLLKDASTIRRSLLIALPHRVQLRGHQLLEDLNATLTAYIRAQLIACVLVGVLCTLGFALLGNPYAILLGVLAAVLEFIPLIGPLVVAFVAVGIAAFGGAAPAVWTATFLMALRIVEDYVIYPRLIGHDTHLHPLVVILAVLAGVELGGIAGIFVAIPIVALVTVVVRHFLAWRLKDAEIRLAAKAAAADVREQA